MHPYLTFGSLLSTTPTIFLSYNHQLNQKLGQVLFTGRERSKHYANLKMTTAITANALKKISFIHSSTF